MTNRIRMGPDETSQASLYISKLIPIKKKFSHCDRNTNSYKKKNRKKNNKIRTEAEFVAIIVMANSSGKRRMRLNFVTKCVRI